MLRSFRVGCTAPCHWAPALKNLMPKSLRQRSIFVTNRLLQYSLCMWRRRLWIDPAGNQLTKPNVKDMVCTRTRTLAPTNKLSSLKQKKTSLKVNVFTLYPGISLIGGGLCNLEQLSDAQQNYKVSGLQKISPFLMTKCYNNIPAALVAMRYKLKVRDFNYIQNVSKNNSAID